MNYESDPSTLEASRSVRAWAWSVIAAKIEMRAAEPVRVPGAGDARLLGHVPKRKRVQRPPCACGNPHYAKGMCRACWHREYDSKRNGPRSGKYRRGPSVREILDYIKRGESLTVIARGAQLTLSAINHRLRRINDPALRAEYAAMHVCPKCQGKKDPSATCCRTCGAKEQEAA